MNIVSISKVNQDAAELFAEHDDYLIEFLGEDRKYYTRYSNNENLENIWVAYSENVPAGCIAYRKKSGQRWRDKKTVCQKRVPW